MIVGKEQARKQGGPVLEACAFRAEALAELPEVEWLAGDPLEVDPRDPDFAAPALSNQWAALAAGRDLLGYQGFHAPGMFAENAQAELWLAEEGGAPEPAAGCAPMVTRWFPGRIERSCAWRGLEAQSTLAVGVRAQVALARLELRNPGAAPRRLRVYVRAAAALRGHESPLPPSLAEQQAAVAFEAERGVLALAARDGAAASVLGADRPPDGARSAYGAEEGPGEEMNGFEVAADAPFVFLAYEVALAPGERWRLRWVQALAATGGEARAAFEDHLACFDARLAEVQAAWQEEWRAAFTAESGRFSGYLPVLRTPDEKLKRLYYMGVLTLLYCKRTPRWGEAGTVYATGLPSSHFTFPVTWMFPWDTMMVAGVLALLDPEALRHMMERWLEADLHQGCAVDFLTGAPAGYWYAVNDYAIIHMAYQYLRYTGDTGWLEKEIRDRPVREHLVDSAHYYRRLAGEDGLADYGGAENLLECVSSYTHKVASFNAANVWNARTVADLLALGGEEERPAALRRQAGLLAAAVQALYVAGEGYWNCRQPDGALVPVRHCLDFFTVMQCMGEDLSAGQKGEMVAFFLRELKTETWMHALSPLDPDTASSSRTDHQDEGAYTTWPAYSLEVLLENGYVEEALAWIGCGGGPGLADVTRQGPFGQAYCHGDAGSPRLAGAGAKAPIELPHIEKPVLLSGGRYAQLVLEALAGVSPGLDGSARVRPQALPLALALDNLRLGGGNACLRAG